MKSIKPGRAGSAMGAFGSLFSIAFGVVWTIIAYGMTSDAGFPFNLFPLFGVFSILAGIGQFLFNLRNTTGENRYSAFDVVDAGDEPDPLNELFGNRKEPRRDFASSHTDNEFCPYCRTVIEQDFEFCPKCGKTLPW